jgi:hypothetical protein
MCATAMERTRERFSVAAMRAGYAALYAELGASGG